MTDLTESSVFTAGVVQLETTDPVIGGPGGKSNEQAQALANRTKYLKDAVESVASDVTDAQADIDDAASDVAAAVASVAAIDAQADAIESDLTTAEASLATLQGQVGSYVIGWNKYTVPAASIAAAALTKDVALFTLPARARISDCIIKASTLFTRPTTGTLTVSVGTAALPTKWIAATRIDTATSATNGATQRTSTTNPPDWSSTTAVIARFTATTDNLNLWTVGSVDLYVLVEGPF